MARGWHTARAASQTRTQPATRAKAKFLRVENPTDRRYAGSIIVSEARGRFFEPAPGRHALAGVQASLAF